MSDVRASKKGPAIGRPVKDDAIHGVTWPQRANRALERSRRPAALCSDAEHLGRRERSIIHARCTRQSEEHAHLEQHVAVVINAGFIDAHAERDANCCLRPACGAMPLRKRKFGAGVAAHAGTALTRNLSRSSSVHQIAMAKRHVGSEHP